MGDGWATRAIAGLSGTCLLVGIGAVGLHAGELERGRTQLAYVIGPPSNPYVEWHGDAHTTVVDFGHGKLKLTFHH